MSADVLVETFLNVCCQELLYYAACIAVPRPNPNFRINRYVTENSLPCLIDARCCNFAESILHVAKNSSCAAVPHLVRSWVPPLCGLHFAGLSPCCTWYEHAPTCVLIIFAALTPCARSATRGFVGVRCLTFTICTKLLGASFDDTVDLVYGRNACFQISPRECNYVTLDPTVNENANTLLARRTNDGSLH